MAGSVNKVILIGHLGADPEMRYTGSGSAVANLSLATNESWKSKDGNKEERTEWHRVVLWSRLAELANQYLKKGRQVYIEGRLQTRSWDDQQTGQKKYSTEIVATSMQFLGGMGEGASMGSRDSSSMPSDIPPPPSFDASGAGSGGNDVADDDIPF